MMQGESCRAKKGEQLSIQKETVSKAQRGRRQRERCNTGRKEEAEEEHQAAGSSSFWGGLDHRKVETHC